MGSIKRRSHYIVILNYKRENASHQGQEFHDFTQNFQIWRTTPLKPILE